ncbi:MAG TPA: translation elongation factor Ts [Fimbriimonadaceae bacterium]|nr:translation elongation factor Ts [Fimbriimonadaceae bacterium]
MKTAIGFPEDDAGRLVRLFWAPLDVCVAALVECKGNFDKAKKVLKEKGFKEMAEFSAKDVMKLREQTDAPMMECKQALNEANGDFEKAKQVLREKGKAAAGKKAGRTTSAGVVAVSASADGKTVGAVVVESETDFVSKNPDFVAMAQKVADYVRDNGGTDNPMENAHLKEMAGEIVAKFRENVQITKAVQIKADAPIASYVHFDNSKGSLIVSEGENAGSEAVRKIAVHVVSLPPEVINKEDLSQEMLDKEIEIETQRAVNEGKDEKIARNIAQGRVNKEYVKKAALMEQPFYADSSKSVSQYLAESAKGTKVTRFVYLAVGQGA